MSRRIVAFERLSADGYFAKPDGSIDWFVPEPALDQQAADSLAGTGTILFGRKTYDQFERFWPHVLDGDEVAGPHGEAASRAMHAMAVWINDAVKIVCTRTRSALPWKNSQQLAEVTPAAIADLKRGAGGDIMLFGSGSIVALLTQHGLIDEYQLVITPLVIGAGRTPFAQARRALELVASDAFPNGNVRLRYRPRA